MNYDYQKLQDWARRRLAGATLQEIATEEGVSREYIRQLMARYTSVRGNDARRGRRSQVASWILGADLGFLTVTEIAKAVGTSPGEVSRVLAQAGIKRRKIHPGKEIVRKWTDDEIVEAIQVVGKSSHLAYDHEKYGFQFDDGRSLPCAASFLKRRNWREWVALAGLPVNKRRSAPYPKTSREECLEAIQRCAREIGQYPTAAVYDAWSRGTDVPSCSTIRNICGRWSVVTKDAGLRPTPYIVMVAP